jgi:hypothetical protein
MLKLGQMSGQAEQSARSRSGQSYHWPQLLRWAPDGKRVSFVFKEALYTVALP